MKKCLIVALLKKFTCELHKGSTSAKWGHKINPFGACKRTFSQGLGLAASPSSFLFGIALQSGRWD